MEQVQSPKDSRENLNNLSKSVDSQREEQTSEQDLQQNPVEETKEPLLEHQNSDTVAPKELHGMSRKDTVQHLFDECNRAFINSFHFFSFYKPISMHH